jgi:ABC-type transporter Mla maintaining outer membrane lipid asymmetry permease subunit MlaE
MSSLTSSRVLAPIGTAGKLFAFGLDVARGLFKRPFQLREFLQQAWFIASVTIVAAYKGMNAAGGPKGVGDAVNEAVVITFMLLFVVNFVMSAIYFQLVPPKTG